MMTQSRQIFKGQVKYSGLTTGSIKWKSGHLLLVKDDRGWKIDLVLAVTQNGRPALSVRITKNTLKRAYCNSSTVYIDVKMDHSSMVINLKPDLPRDCKVLKDLLYNIQTEGPQEIVPKAEVCVIEDSPSKKFTSVKETRRDKLDDKESIGVKEVWREKIEEFKENLGVNEVWRDGFDEEQKENSGFPNKSEEFLQRGLKKASAGLSSSSQRFYGKGSSFSPKPLLSITPSKQIQSSGKRQPGLMPDPTPTKKSRLSSFLPNYSMKTKLFSSDEQKTQENSTAQQQTLQGFSNLGNTCYMNAILQSLFGLDTFATDLFCNRRILRYLSNQSLYNAMCKLLSTKRQQTATDLSKRESLRRVKSAISNSAKRFSGYGQHDAHEFLGQVLDQLKEEIVKISKSTPSPSREEEVKFDCLPSPASSPSINPVTDNFEFEILHTISCEKCSNELTKTEQFHDVSVDVPRRKDVMTPRSLQDAIALFFRKEKFEYKCENCGHDKSDVSHKITRLPRIFIIHLKRYTYNQMFSKNTKMGQNVTIPLYLTLKNHCTEETQPAFPPNFNTSFSDQKSVLEDSTEEDVPSRRKLEYKSQFMEKGSEQKNDHSYFTQTKDKKDEDPDIARAIEMSLKDMEQKDQKDDADDDMARAIELSLKEHEERETQLKDVFGDDSDAELEKALEMSRQDHNNGMEVSLEDSWSPNAEDKENKDPTSERPELSDPQDLFGDVSDNSSEEADRHVDECIELPVIKNDKGELPYSYRLVSIVNHMGMSSITGHYLSDVYDMKKHCWYSYDDSHVVTIPESEVTTKRERSGYIFFYMNKDTFDDLKLNHSVKMSSPNS